MTLPVRRATFEDLPACARIVCAWQQETPYMLAHISKDVVLPMMQQAFAARQMWVAGDPVEGYLSVDPAEQKIGAIYLERRGTGTGHVFMETAKAGRDFLWLTVYLPNTRAQAFYRREGFQVVATLPPLDAGEPEIYRMEWHRQVRAA